MAKKTAWILTQGSMFMTQLGYSEQLADAKMYRTKTNAKKKAKSFKLLKHSLAKVVLWEPKEKQHT